MPAEASRGGERGQGGPGGLRSSFSPRQLLSRGPFKPGALHGNIKQGGCVYSAIYSSPQTCAPWGLSTEGSQGARSTTARGGTGRTAPRGAHSSRCAPLGTSIPPARQTMNSWRVSLPSWPRKSRQEVRGPGPGARPGSEAGRGFPTCSLSASPSDQKDTEERKRGPGPTKDCRPPGHPSSPPLPSPCCRRDSQSPPSRPAPLDWPRGPGAGALGTARAPYAEPPGSGPRKSRRRAGS